MKELRLKQLFRFIAILSLGLTVTCGHATMTPPPSVGSLLRLANPGVPPPTVHVIPFYNFGKSAYNGGLSAFGGLIGSEAALYAATVLGGDAKCSTPFDSGSSTGCGIVYRLVRGGGLRPDKLVVIHTFGGAPSDGAASVSTLLADSNGDLYGTTFYGGEYNEGTLFKLHPTSSGYIETIVHNFGYGQDGAYPASGVVELKRTLYGTTVGGGAYSNQSLCGVSGGSPNGTCGTVYRLSLDTGAETVLHSFGNGNDGATPRAAPVAVGGRLYGTTFLGGTLPLCGTVYKILTDGGGETILHSFRNNPNDGCDPAASLISVKGTLYGTTCCGGRNYCGQCEGTIFSVDPATKTERVLHNFGNGQDGSEPVAALVNVGGVLYGTTSIGGGTGCQSGFGCGTIFSFAPSSSSSGYNLVYAFTGVKDGASPRAPLLYSNGALYSTTAVGGKKGLGTADRARL